MAWIGGLISGIGSLGSSILNGIFGQNAQNKANETNLQIARETNQANRQLAEYEWNKNLEMWKMQNEYNSPASQMQRYKDAGLNPNLIYGQGSSGNATSLPKYSAPTMQPVTVHPAVFQLNNALDVLGKYMDYRIKSAQEQQIEQQTSNMWYQQHMLWPVQSNLWSSQKDYWTNNANRLFELLPFEKRNYNSLISNRSDTLFLNRLRFEFDRDKWRYDYQLRKDLQQYRINYLKQQERDLYMRNNFFENWGVLPNTQFGQRFGAYRLLYGPGFGTPLENSKRALKTYLDTELDMMMTRTVSPFLGLFGNRGRNGRWFNFNRRKR